MAQQRWFYSTDQQWQDIQQRLKLTPCPHCKCVGYLIRHGFLRGYDGQTSQRKTIRARRVFCSNRGARLGCGRTFSIWLADKIRRLSLTTRSLWAFLQRAVTGSIPAAMAAGDSCLSPRTWQRIWTRFRLAQSNIRTALLGRCSPPKGPPQPSSRPTEAQALSHLQAAFPDDCPIAAFQNATRSFFL